MEERGRYYPRTDCHYYHWQPFIMEKRRRVDERKLFDGLQRCVKFKIKRRYCRTGNDDLADEKYEVRYLRTYNIKYITIF